MKLPLLVLRFGANMRFSEETCNDAYKYCFNPDGLSSLSGCGRNIGDREITGSGSVLGQLR